MGRWIFRVVLLVILVGGPLAALIGLGQWSRDEVKSRDRFDVPFRSIVCPEPPTLALTSFLDEVQYLGSFPDRLKLLDEGLAHRLAEAFAKHPWVEKVESVTLTPSRQIHVKCSYRQPVLAVRWNKQLHVVDGFGVLLRNDASSVGLPMYDGPVVAPQGPPGTRWGDPGVEAKARLLRRK